MLPECQYTAALWGFYQRNKLHLLALSFSLSHSQPPLLYMVSCRWLALCWSWSSSCWVKNGAWRRLRDELYLAWKQEADLALPLPDLACIYRLGPLSLSCTHPLAFLGFSLSLPRNSAARCERRASVDAVFTDVGRISVSSLVFVGFSFGLVSFDFFYICCVCIFLVVLHIYCCSATHELSIHKHLCFSQHNSIMII